jgi:acylphosphatase
MSGERTALRARVTGRVQGVGYRAWVAGEARRLGLAGWVRNEPDGAVTALLAGPREDVERMLEAMLRGPRAAVVAAIATEAAEEAEAPAGFEIRR